MTLTSETVSTAWALMNVRVCLIFLISEATRSAPALKEGTKQGSWGLGHEWFLCVSVCVRVIFLIAS